MLVEVLHTHTHIPHMDTIVWWPWKTHLTFQWWGLWIRHNDISLCWNFPRPGGFRVQAQFTLSPPMSTYQKNTEKTSSSRRPPGYKGTAADAARNTVLFLFFVLRLYFFIFFIFIFLNFKVTYTIFQFYFKEKIVHPKVEHMQIAHRMMYNV